MSVFHSLEFDGVNSLDNGVYITGEAVYNTPERDIEMLEIPGRNGSYALDKGRYQNIEVEYPAGAFGDTQADFSKKIRAFRNLMSSKVSYKKLVDDYNPDEYRMAVFKNAIEVSPFNGRAGEFDLIFDCKPQRFLMIGETSVDIATGDSIYNPTPFASNPLIKVTGYGTLYVGSYPVAIASGATNPIYLDCDIMDAYEINSSNVIVNRNNLITLSTNTYPKIEPGNQAVTFTGNITKVEITPRWWIL